MQTRPPKLRRRSKASPRASVVSILILLSIALVTVDRQKRKNPQRSPAVVRLSNVVEKKKSVSVSGSVSGSGSASTPSSSTASPRGSGDGDNATSDRLPKHIYKESKTTPPFGIFMYPLELDGYLSRSVIDKGYYEEDVTRFIERVIPYRKAGDSSDDGDTGNVTDRRWGSASTAASAEDGLWAVDIGSNIGFHGLHMAARGARVFAFEPSPDTLSLLRKSASRFNSGRGGEEERGSSSWASVEVVGKAASDAPGTSRLSRYDKSPGFTSLAEVTPFSLRKAERGTALDADIELVRPDGVLREKGVPEGDPGVLRLLKVDAEGYELHAIRGLNLTRYPFRYLAFEWFPKMLQSCGSDPLDLLEEVYSHGYLFLDGPNPGKIIEAAKNDVRVWGESMIKRNEKRNDFHINLFASLT